MGRCISVLPWVLSAVLLAAPVARANDYDEATSGDLSGDRTAPTTLTLTPGVNTISGTVIAGDLDYLSVTVPGGYTLSEINLLNFVSADDLAFIGMQAGPTFTEPPSGTDVTKLLGWAHYHLPTPAPYFNVLGTAAGAIGFSGPLPAGPYTFWLQQTGPQLVTYSWGLVVSGATVPEPAAAGLALLGLAALLGRVANRFLGRPE